ncbi:hypothetical protein D3C71_1410740 [compost metagenome]
MPTARGGCRTSPSLTVGPRNVSTQPLSQFSDRWIPSQDHPVATVTVENRLPCVGCGIENLLPETGAVVTTMHFLSAPQETSMPFEYLREIAQTPLPLTVDQEANIDKLRVLRAADLVSVMLPSPASDSPQFARVLAITPKGRQMLAQELERSP